MPTPAEPRAAPAAPAAAPSRATVPRAVDVALALALAGGYLAWLLSTVSDLGYARDEGFYYQAARAYQAWFDLLLQDPAQALSPAVVDQYWQVNHEHPALMKTLFALSRRLLFERWGWFAEPGTAHRFPGMVMGSLAVALVFVWGRLAVSRRAGIVAALLFALLPRVFCHAHLACFDVAAAAMWTATALSLWLAVERRSLPWALGTGVAYGLFLDTKHNAWLFPAVVVAVTALDLFDWRRAALRSRRPPAPWALLSVLALGPLVLYAAWPWLWHDPLARVAEWVRFHTRHDYYNMEFLGVTHHRPPMPRLYAWVMTAATVPGITLLLCLLGLGAGIVQDLGARWPRLAARLTGVGSGADLGPAAGPVRGRTTVALWLLSVAAAYAPWWSTSTPIFGGTKHWLTAYPFLCLFAGLGFEVVVSRLERVLAATGARAALAPALPAAVGLAVVAGPLAMTAGSHPWGLTAYTPLVGGAPGAASLGLNRTFWGTATGAVQGSVNALTPPEGRVYVHDTALQSFALLREDGRLRADLRGTLDIAGSELQLFHHEPHMSRVEHQIWVTHGTVAPAVVGAYQGVPVVWLYTRPR